MTITGTGFTGATDVGFGPASAAAMTVDSDTQITATTPPGTGTVDITVTTPAGTSATSPADQFTYTAAATAPVITGISPHQRQRGRRRHRDHHRHRVHRRHRRQLRPGQRRRDDRRLRHPDHRHHPARQRHRRHHRHHPRRHLRHQPRRPVHLHRPGAGPVITGVSPASGSAAGGDTVTITGTGFTGATDVAFGPASAAAMTVDSDTQITATTPPGSGTVDITVTTPAGTSATSPADQFSYS